jgi:hypothetical protein
MFKNLYYSVLLLVICSTACEEVIDVDLPENDTRLVVNGVIRVDETQEYVPIEIKVLESSTFFENNTVASIQSAVITYGTPNPDAPEILEGGGVSNLAEVQPGSGIWVPDPSFDSDQRIRVANINEGDVFRLIITTSEETYFASTTYVKSVPIESLEQGTQTLFSEDETEIVVSFTDIEERNDFYIFDFGFNEFLVSEDEFYQGQTFEFSYFYEDGIEPGTELNISLLGADEGFYNYMNQVIVQSGGDQGPFQTPAATVRGNVLNITGINNIDVFDNIERSDNFGLGYFAVIQEYKSSITIE